ncbi:hypothetical protein [Burkholderia pseudomallei]|uniref:hypothetical protein n=1 Tax=Burkholderia pseudomallei TaxID=28450 RepID=UPI0015C3140D|nr:hypothetical protein [Burkholderia pseudomallei]
MRFARQSDACARRDPYRFVTACSSRARCARGFPQGSRYAAKPHRRPEATLGGPPQAPQAPKRPARAVRAGDARAARGKPAHASVCYTKSGARPGLY